MQVVAQLAHTELSGYMTALGYGLKTLIPLAGATHPVMVSDWESEDGLVRGHFNERTGDVWLEADEGHSRADLSFSQELLCQRGWEPFDDPLDDLLLEDGGVRVYYQKVSL